LPNCGIDFSFSLGLMKREAINSALRLIFQAIQQLKDAFPNRGFTIDGRLVGDIGEVIAALEYDIVLHDISQPTDSICEARQQKVLSLVSALPEASDEVCCGRHLSFKVRGKTFGYFLNNHHGNGRVALNCKTAHLRGDKRTFPFQF
jgi:Family of unknown function (DUF6998)